MKTIIENMKTAGPLGESLKPAVAQKSAKSMLKKVKFLSDLAGDVEDGELMGEMEYYTVLGGLMDDIGYVLAKQKGNRNFKSAALHLQSAAKEIEQWATDQM